MRTLASALGASLALLAAHAHAQPIGIVDQQHAPPAGVVFQNYVGAWTAAGQTFSPRLDRIDAATFVLYASGATLQLSLYGGVGIGGPLLGTSAPTPVTNSGFELVRFDLLAPVALVPHADYTLFVRALTGSFVGEYSSAAPYGYGGGGALDGLGDPAPDVDLVFAEGIEPTVTPEPAPFALAGAGLLLLGAYARAVSARSAAPGTARPPRS